MKFTTAVALAAAAQVAFSVEVVSQIWDGQIQAPTETRAAAVVTTETKPATEAKATTEAKPATEAKATTEARATDVISQIWDGQIQAPATTHPVVQQMENGAGRAIANMGAVVAVAALFL